MKVLMIGNSFCYYYVEELHDMAKAVGIDIEVCNVYYSGCSLKQHWTWLEEGAVNYEFFITNENGRNKEKPCDLQYCLDARDWDVISLQSASTLYPYEKEDTIKGGEPYVGKLYQYLREQFPNARYLWHHTWISQVGYRHVTDPNNVILDKETQNHRADKRIGDALCNRVNSEGEDKTDFHHDGNVGGGCYLNACVWFEILTGKSCIGNTYVPEYDLSKEKIKVLQEIAHEAVKRKLH